MDRCIERLRFISLLPLGAGSLLALAAWQLGIGATAALAQQSPSPPPSTEQKPAQQQPPQPAGFWDTVQLSGHLETGITLNPNFGDEHTDYGQLVTDKADTPLLNQLVLTLQRPIDPKSNLDLGFKFQFLYGSDARYYNYLNEFTRATKDIDQFEFVEANLTGHFALAAGSSVDVKVGQYPTPLGFEVIDPTGNFFYSHSYTFNFASPFVHTGGYATWHATDMIDVYLGGDSGVNTSLFHGDNNGSPSLLGGFGLNLMGGNLTLLALTHIGPEIPTNNAPAGVHVNADNRYYNDAVITYKASDALALTTELNYLKDDQLPNAHGSFGSESWSVAQYAIYTLNDQVSLGARAELFDDISGDIVGDFIGNNDAVNAQLGDYGLLSPRDRTGGSIAGSNGNHTMFGALTLGVNYKPAGVPDAFKGLVIRPEIRWDQALTNTKPFEGKVDSVGTVVGTSSHQFTAAVDLIIPF